MKLLRGVGRKLSLPVLVVSLLGWMAYVVGFALLNNRDTFYNDYRTVGINVSNVSFHSDGTVLRRDTSMPAHRASLDWFPHWCFLIAGPFMFICMFLHLCIGRWFSGIFTNFLTCLYLVTGGGVIYFWALRLFSEGREGYRFYFNLQGNDWLKDEYWGLWPLVEWVGCLASVFFLSLFMMMWPCFHSKRRGQEEYYGEDQYYDEEEQYQEEEYQGEEYQGEEMEEYQAEEGEEEEEKEEDDQAPLETTVE